MQERDVEELKKTYENLEKTDCVLRRNDKKIWRCYGKKI